MRTFRLPLVLVVLTALLGSVLVYLSLRTQREMDVVAAFASTADLGAEGPLYERRPLTYGTAAIDASTAEVAVVADVLADSARHGFNPDRSAYGPNLFVDFFLYTDQAFQCRDAQDQGAVRLPWVADDLETTCDDLDDLAGGDPVEELTDDALLIYITTCRDRFTTYTADYPENNKRKNLGLSDPAYLDPTFPLNAVNAEDPESFAASREALLTIYGRVTDTATRAHCVEDIPSLATPQSPADSGLLPSDQPAPPPDD